MEPDAAPINDLDPAMSFFGTTIEAEDDALSLKSGAEEEDGEGKKSQQQPPHPHPHPHPHPPPPRPQAPPQSTQDLISTVSSQLEETSSELLGRIPATRSPSPVSMRDLHSPSPTPDSGLADLLDVSVDSGSSAHIHEVDLISGVTGAAVPPPNPLDNPFGVPTAVPSLQGATPMPASPAKQPPRPPPPRPAPPRPTPPAGHMPPQRPPPPAAVPANPPAPAAASADADDLLDMFSTSSKPAKPPPPKTKEDILSLFEQPAPQPVVAPKPDLLNDDLPVTPPEKLESEMDAEGEPEPAREEPIFSSLLTRPDESTHDITSQPQAATVKDRQSNHMAAPQDATNRQRAPTPDIEITTVEDLPRSDDEDEEPVEVVRQPEPEPSETKPESPPTEVAPEIAPVAEPVEPAIEPEPELEPEPEQMDTGLDFAPVASGQLSANPFASPEEEDEPSFAPVPVVGNIFAVDDPEPEAEAEPEPAVEPPVAPSYVTNIFAAEPDEFDAFSAKFDSVKKDNISILDGFGGSGAITPTGGDGK